MIDLTIEKALAPDKPDWKEPLWAKFKSYAVGFGAALLVVGAVIAAIAYFAEPLAPQTEVSTVEPAPVAKAEPTRKAAKKPAKSATEKIAAQAVNATATAVTGNPVSVPKPRIKDDFNAEFDKEQARFEANLKKEFP